MEGRQVMPTGGWVVGATVERGAVWSEKYTHWPATLTGEGYDEAHIDAVQVGALFPVHLEVDEMAVHQLCNPGILEGFVSHNMAPMTGGITDAKEDRLVRHPGFL